MAIYQARFNRYLEDRGLKKPSDSKVWAFLGDGETDEPETLGAITLAAREKLDNLIFVINCNLQRLDRPGARQRQNHPGAGSRIPRRRLERDQSDLGRRLGSAAGAGSMKVCCVKRMDEVVDGWFLKYTVESGDFIREHFFGAHPKLQKDGGASFG